MTNGATTTNEPELKPSEIVTRLIKLVMRAFYSPEKIILTDALLEYEFVLENDLTTQVSLPKQRVRQILSELEAEKIVSHHSEYRFVMGKRNKEEFRYWWIDYKQFIDVMQYRFYHLQRLVKEQEKQVDVYQCTTCKAEYDEFELGDLYDSKTQRYVCSYCKRGEVDQVTLDETGQGSTNVGFYKVFETQFSSILHYLDLAKKLVVPKLYKETIVEEGEKMTAAKRKELQALEGQQSLPVDINNLMVRMNQIMTEVQAQQRLVLDRQMADINRITNSRTSNLPAGASAAGSAANANAGGASGYRRPTTIGGVSGLNSTNNKPLAPKVVLEKDTFDFRDEVESASKKPKIKEAPEWFKRDAPLEESYARHVEDTSINMAAYQEKDTTNDDEWERQDLLRKPTSQMDLRELEERKRELLKEYMRMQMENGNKEISDEEEEEGEEDFEETVPLANVNQEQTIGNPQEDEFEESKLDGGEEVITITVQGEAKRLDEITEEDLQQMTHEELQEYYRINNMNVMMDY